MWLFCHTVSSYNLSRSTLDYFRSNNPNQYFYEQTKCDDRLISIRLHVEKKKTVPQPRAPILMASHNSRRPREIDESGRIRNEIRITRTFPKDGLPRGLPPPSAPPIPTSLHVFCRIRKTDAFIKQILIRPQFGLSGVIWKVRVFLFPDVHDLMFPETFPQAVSEFPVLDVEIPVIVQYLVRCVLVRGPQRRKQMRTEHCPFVYYPVDVIVEFIRLEYVTDQRQNWYYLKIYVSRPRTI